MQTYEVYPDTTIFFHLDKTNLMFYVPDEFEQNFKDTHIDINGNLIIVRNEDI